MLKHIIAISAALACQAQVWTFSEKDPRCEVKWDKGSKMYSIRGDKIQVWMLDRTPGWPEFIANVAMQNLSSSQIEIRPETFTVEVAKGDKVESLKYVDGMELAKKVGKVSRRERIGRAMQAGGAAMNETEPQAAQGRVEQRSRDRRNSRAAAAAWIRKGAFGRHTLDPARMSGARCSSLRSRRRACRASLR